ncbi:RAMP superfamily protein [Phormidium pseudopriestleyi FRX01]|uniref:RAMP superfamily protein n=1 Tax=Phormidium pseudopriestleyi FRX01 TaxID=1759528 RepID=A0ABS3FN16_9CYAN|nr:RAMP superfamily protein [Phormidium pseudopriestleyi FRX01]
MSIYQLKIKLLSDTTFGRGDGVAGLLDQEVEYDSHGFPYLRGRTLKGLLSEECDNLVAVLPNDGTRENWQQVAADLLGSPGSTLDTIAQMHVGDACLPKDLREAVAQELKFDPNLKSVDILESLTSIRRQTAIDPKEGIPDKHSLRSARVILRDLEFMAFLHFETSPTDEMLSLLVAGIWALRRVGSGRNRGRGHVRCRLFNDQGQEMNEDYLPRFGAIEKQAV